jgi:potassium-transporting ATPase ATP-binding subunit
MSAPESSAISAVRPAPSAAASIGCYRALRNPQVLLTGARHALVKLNPRDLVTNPVMFVAEAAAVLNTAFLLHDLLTRSAERSFEFQAAFWLWLTVLFGTFAEALADASGRARAKQMRESPTNVLAKRVGKDGKLEIVAASQLRRGDLVVAQAGDLIPGDGEIVEGIATIDESVVTGESAPVIRESTGELRVVTAGSRVLSDKLTILIGSTPPETFLDKTIAAAEAARGQKTAAEIKLNAFLSGVTLVLVIAVMASYPFATEAIGTSSPARAVAVLVALLICLLPITIGGLLPAISVGAINQAMYQNVLATSRKAVDTLGRVHVLLLDKTGTITFGKRRAVEFIPFPGVSPRELAEAAQLSSFSDNTPEGQSTVALAMARHLLPEPEVTEEMMVIPFSSYTRISGVDIGSRRLRKGATSAIAAMVKEAGKPLPEGFKEVADRISQTGRTPLAVSDDGRVLGLIVLQDAVKSGIREQMSRIHQMGMRSVMLTGDNPVTAAAIAKEAGVDDVLPQATPADKLAFIKKHQANGEVVAMTGDGTEDAPAIAQADIGVAMDTGEMPAKEAANFVDLDSNPAKLVDIFAIGKHLHITRSALAAFSLANSLTILLMVVPAVFGTAWAGLDKLNLLNFLSPRRVLLAGVIFRAITLLAFIPVAVCGSKSQIYGPDNWRNRRVLHYAIFGLLLPVPVLWTLDKILALLHIS